MLQNGKNLMLIVEWCSLFQSPSYFQVLRDEIKTNFKKSRMKDQRLFTCCVFQTRETRLASAQTANYMKHNGKFICLTGDCRKEFHSSELLLCHQYENNHLVLLCCMCDRVFTYKTALLRHIRSIHLELQEKHVCSQCSIRRTFKRKDNLHQHQRKVHGMITCELCGTGFTDAKILKEHMFTHNIVKKKWKRISISLRDVFLLIHTASLVFVKGGESYVVIGTLKSILHVVSK